MADRSKVETKQVTSVRLEPTIKEFIKKEYGSVQVFLDNHITDAIALLSEKKIKKFRLKQWVD